MSWIAIGALVIIWFLVNYKYFRRRNVMLAYEDATEALVDWLNQHPDIQACCHQQGNILLDELIATYKLVMKECPETISGQDFLDYLSNWRCDKHDQAQ